MTIDDKKAELQAKLDNDVATFLRHGGKIKVIEPGITGQGTAEYKIKGGRPRSKNGENVWRDFDAFGNPTGNKIIKK